MNDESVPAKQKGTDGTRGPWESNKLLMGDLVTDKQGLSQKYLESMTRFPGSINQLVIYLHVPIRFRAVQAVTQTRTQIPACATGLRLHNPTERRKACCRCWGKGVNQQEMMTEVQTFIN